ncbi:MAG: ABC transporter substrate-binding protein, partial [Actinobacteria bacterium]|nr:ABC transporter substrate-binding protein [Actinomycetota bacterium]
TAIAAALASRSIDVTSLGIQELALADERKLGIVGLTNTAKGPTEFGVISEAWAQKAGITANSSFEAKIKALRGAKVGLGAPGSTTTTVALLTFRNYGLEPGKDVTTVNLGSGPAQVSAFKQGQIDAFFWIPPLTHTSGGILADFRDAPMWNGVNWSGWVTTSDFLRDHPDTVEAFLRAMIKAWNYTLKFPDAASQIAARALPQLAVDPVAFKAAFDADYKSWTAGMRFTQKGYLKALSIASNNTGKAVQSTIATATNAGPTEKAASQVGISIGPWKPDAAKKK